jgi:threonine dehydratase
LRLEVPWGSGNARYMEGELPCKVVGVSYASKTNRMRQNVRIPSLYGVQEAAAAVARIVPPTPLLEIEIGGMVVFAKAESLQPIGAFKLRGAWHRLSALSDDARACGVVAFSSGNHAQGVAWAARKLGIAATIVMPRDAPIAKIDRTRDLGAAVILYDRLTQSREGIARDVADRSGATIIPPFADPWVIEGQGSVGIEATAQMAAMGIGPPDLVVACCGGGGLASGLALAIPDAAIITVEPEGWDDMARSLATGAIVEVADTSFPTACDALMTISASPLTFDILHSRGATGISVSPPAVEDAMRFAFTNLRLVIEPGGAVALAAILSGQVTPTKRTLITLSGGNVDAARFAAVITR